MEQADYHALVERYLVEAAVFPGRYRWRVLGILALGHGFLASAILLLVLIAAGVALAAVLAPARLLLIGALAVPLGVLAFMAARVLWVTAPLCHGVEIAPESAPGLWALLEEERARAGAPRLARVVVGHEPGAGISMTPRFGLFGGNRHHLRLGLPMLQSMTTEQLRAVVAHEFGHVSTSASLLGRSVLELSGRWLGLLERLERTQHRTGPIEAFARWYAPRFSAITVGLARESEYIADRVSADATSPAVAAGALTQLAVVDRRLSLRIWPEIRERSRTEPGPPERVYALLAEMLATPLPDEVARRWAARECQWSTAPDHDHPSLADRLRELGFEAPPMPAATLDSGRSAACLLGPAEEVVVRRLSEEWAGSIRQSWDQEHREVAAARARLAVLEAGSTLSPPERLERLVLRHRAGGNESARGLAEAWVGEGDAPPFACFVAGESRLDEGDDSGLALIASAADRDDEAIRPALETALRFLLDYGRREEATRWYARTEERLDLLERARQERSTHTPGECFDPHGLPPESVECIRDAVIRWGDTEAVYLVRKRVSLLPERPAWVCVVVFDVHRDDEQRTLAARDALEKNTVFPRPTLYLVRSPDSAADVIDSVVSVAGSRIL